MDVQTWLNSPKSQTRLHEMVEDREAALFVARLDGGVESRSSNIPELDIDGFARIALELIVREPDRKIHFRPFEGSSLPSWDLNLTVARVCSKWFIGIVSAEVDHHFLFDLMRIVDGLEEPETDGYTWSSGNDPKGGLGAEVFVFPTTTKKKN